MSTVQMPNALQGEADHLAGVISRDLASGRYCSIVGPHKTGKSHIARSVVHMLQNDKLLGEQLVLSQWDLRSNSTVFKEPLYLALARAVNDAFANAGATPLPLEAIDLVHDSTSFHRLLLQFLSSTRLSLLLVVDHLEAVPEYVAKSLLECLRVIYSERDIDKQLRGLKVLVVGTVKIEAMSSDQTSPFVSNKHIVEGISLEDARILLSGSDSGLGDLLSKEAIARALELVGGDPVALSYILEKGAELSDSTKHRPLDARQAEELLREYGRVVLSGSESYYWATSLIEMDLSALGVIVRLLKGEEVKCIGRAMETDLELSGSVSRQEDGTYGFRNYLYEDLLKARYSVGALAELWLRNGQWREAASQVAFHPAFENDRAARSRFINASGVATVGVTSIKEFSEVLLDLASTIAHGKATALLLTDATGRKVEWVFTRGGSDSAWPDIQKGRLHENNPRHQAVSQALVLRRPYFAPSPSGRVTVTFPIVHRDGVMHGVLQVNDFLQPNGYWPDLILLEEMRIFANNMSASLSWLRDYDSGARRARTWFAVSVVFGTALVGEAFPRILHALSPSTQSGNGASSAILAANSVLLLSSLVSWVVLGYWKIPNDLVRNLLAAIAIVVAILTALLGSERLIAGLSSALWLGLLALSQILAALLIVHHRQNIATSGL